MLFEFSIFSWRTIGVWMKQPGYQELSAGISNEDSWYPSCLAYEKLNTWQCWKVSGLLKIQSREWFGLAKDICTISITQINIL